VGRGQLRGGAQQRNGFVQALGISVHQRQAVPFGGEVQRQPAAQATAGAGQQDVQFFSRHDRPFVRLMFPAPVFVIGCLPGKSTIRDHELRRKPDGQ